MADNLQLGIRVYDPKEKKDATMAASHFTVDFPRSDATLKVDDFIAKYIRPNLAKLKNLPLDAT
jgi:hypothetical protein